MTREDYIILGFDLSPYREQIYTDEWRTDENIDKWECCQTKGNIQLFTDPMSGSHLYFGYILSAQDEFDEPEVTKISLRDREIKYMDEMWEKVLEALSETKIISESMLEAIAKGKIPFELICFTEYR
ncbi:MAG TPA: hypothetical protein K8V91_04775 [[Clostridium] spiroforme]|uniref:Uncharacterized protein n=1 Tax=Thomasclavelia spiroformis TaxID=29348 RepID=A0A921GAW0_9FIRM|nr:hypothetical protein [Thomasclavelia spiroformis]